MKNKIATKLFLLFAGVLLVFSVVVGGSFAYLFKQHTLEVKHQDLESRAVRIAQALSDNQAQIARYQAEHSQQQPSGEHQHKRLMTPRQGPMGLGFRSVLRFLGSAAAEDVWIIDNEQHLELPTNKEGKAPAFMYKDIPPEAAQVVQKVLQGELASSESFSELLKTPTMTVGAPIKDAEGQVLGAVLIHTPLAGLEDATKQGLRILLICGTLALLLAGVAAVYFAWRFTRPLKTMQKTAEELQQGHYLMRCHINQADEIGELGTALDVLGDRLLVASKESAQLEQLRRDFIANISHELRTPVTVIRGSLEALQDGLVTEPAQLQEYYSQMLKESVYLQRLINDLLELTRLQNANFKLELVELNLCELLQDVARSARQLAQSKDIKLELELDCESYPLQGDYGRLRQMLLVFIDNAVKFSPEQSTVQLRLAGHELSVVDHGSGVSAEDLPHVFERFYKARMELNKTGTGLGLAIAKEIAERHRIHLTMESTPGKLTRVVMVLP